MRNLLLIAAIFMIGCGGNANTPSPYVGRWKGQTMEPHNVPVEFKVYDSGRFDGVKAGLPCEGSIANGRIRFADGHHSDFAVVGDRLEGDGISVGRLREPS